MKTETINILSLTMSCIALLLTIGNIIYTHYIKPKRLYKWSVKTTLENAEKHRQYFQNRIQ
jgi:hypothetical protein